MSEKIIVKQFKTLKLENTLSKEISQQDLFIPTKALHMINSYISSKNVKVRGPLINYSFVKTDENGEPSICSKFIFQLDEQIVSEFPYVFEKTIVEQRCLFARFQEKEEYLQLAYQKLSVYAFENDINLRGDNYTVFVKKDANNCIVADIFMPTKD